ncbi:hypothetical protein [Akkermansia sp. 54_46]|uniref:hypothetical protein n=1 Tax=Akkermansia sp. 54_46 TaxID=1896967 RepID=UPI0009632F7D|nr:hypothetical protein [Akkermansia sp. 54_46]OLA87881.1 MAG: hypothetical protein BHW66_12850 [Akkermansia sp. 54_46]
MGQIIGNALSSGNYRTMASVARSQGRAQQAAYNLKANNLEEEARADSRLAALNMSRMRENQASNQASARVRQASSGFAAEGSSMQNELALADVFEKSIADMALSNALSDSGKRTAAMASRQQGRLSMMQADAQAGQYNRLAKSARNAAWIQGASTLLSAAAGGIAATPEETAAPTATAGTSGKATAGGGASAGAATAGTTLPSWLTGALSSGQSAYDLSGNFLQWSPGTISSSRASSTNAGSALNDLLVALLGQSASPSSTTPPRRQ